MPYAARSAGDIRRVEVVIAPHPATHVDRSRGVRRAGSTARDAGPGSDGRIAHQPTPVRIGVSEHRGRLLREGECRNAEPGTSGPSTPPSSTATTAWWRRGRPVDVARRRGLDVTCHRRGVDHEESVDLLVVECRLGSRLGSRWPSRCQSSGRGRVDSDQPGMPSAATASRPGLRELLITAMFGPSRVGCVASTRTVSSKRRHRRHLDDARLLIQRAGYAAPTDAAPVRTATIGLVRETRRAILANLRGLPNDSV